MRLVRPASHNAEFTVFFEIAIENVADTVGPSLGIIRLSLL